MSPMMERSDSSVGIRLLNVDHREMEDVINQLQVAIMVGRDRDWTIRLLRRLSDFTRTHFALEEGMMSATEYPNLAAHCGCHQQLLQQLDAYISLYLKGRLNPSRESLKFLFVWHATHSQVNDAHYADWLVMRHADFRQNEPAESPHTGREASARSGRSGSFTPSASTPDTSFRTAPARRTKESARTEKPLPGRPGARAERPARRSPLQS